MAGYSATGAFFKQAQAGAQQQKKAREELKSPGSALGGAAAAGTAMVKAGTAAEQNVAQNVANTTETAAKDLTAKDVGTSNQNLASTMVAPTSTTGTTPTTISTPSSTTLAAPTIIQSATGDVFTTSTNQNNIQTNITNIQTELDNLDEKLKTANAQDAAAINAEKTRLTEELNKYNKMLTEGNLGEIAGPSTYESEMMTRMGLLANEDVGNIGKLAAFGGRNLSKFGGLTSQVYGKDIENLTQEAGEALRERGLATEERQRRRREFEEQLGLSKKTSEEKLDDATERVEILKKSPEELKTVTKTEVEKLFGATVAEQLFDFDDKGYISNTNTNQVRQVYVDAKKKQEDILKDQELESTRALENETKDLGSTKDLANKIIKDVANIGGWLGERGPQAITPIVNRLDALVADFNEQQKYFKTPEQRKAGLETLNAKIKNEKTNLSNELGAFLADTNTDMATAESAYNLIIQNGLLEFLSPDMVQAVYDRIDDIKQIKQSEFWKNVTGGNSNFNIRV